MPPGPIPSVEKNNNKKYFSFACGPFRVAVKCLDDYVQSVCMRFEALALGVEVSITAL